MKVQRGFNPPINDVKTLSEMLDFPAAVSNTQVLSCLALPVETGIY